MPMPPSPFLDIVDKRQEGLLSPAYFIFNARGYLFKNIILTEKINILSSPTRGCSMKVSDDCFLLAPANLPKLLMYKYDKGTFEYKLAGTIPFPNKPLFRYYNPSDKRFSFKFIDFEPHAFTATNCDKLLHFGDPETCKIIEQISHPSDISQHRISKLCPFNIIAGAVNEHIYISDLRTGSVVMSIFRNPRVNYSEQSVSWSPISDRLVCSLVNSYNHNYFPIALFDLRRPDSNIAPQFNCDYYNCSDNVPFVDFLDNSIGNLIVTFVNDSYIRIWNLLGELIQLIKREKPIMKFDHMQPAILPSNYDTFIFIPDREGIQVHSSTKMLYSIKVLNADMSILGYSKSLNHIIGISSYSFKTVYIWECGKSKEFSINL